MRFLVQILCSIILFVNLAKAEDLTFCHYASSSEADGRILMAINNYSRCIESGNLEASTLSAAYVQRGVIYLNRKDYEDAKHDFDAAIRADPNNAYAFSNRGRLHYNVGDYRDSIADHSSSIDLDSDNPGFYYLRGTSYLQAKDYQLALLDLENAILLDQSYADPHVARGFILRQMGEPELAIRAFTEALRIDPSRGLTWARRGGAFHDMDRLDEAFEDYNKSLRYGFDNPDSYAEVYSQKCRILALRKEPRRALEECNRSLYTTRDNPQALENRALAHWLLGNLEQAAHDLERAREIDPSRPSPDSILREFEGLF